MQRGQQLIWLVVGLLYSAPAAARCVTVPEGAEQPVVSACETDEDYTFNVLDVTTSYPKSSFRARLRAELAAWLATVGLQAPADAVIEFWLAVPEADPAATQARAALRSDSLNLVWYLALHPDEWRVSHGAIGMLGDAAYPDSFGHRPGQVLVKAAGPAEGERRALLAELGASDPTPYAANWSIYATDAGQELDVMAAVVADPRSATLIERIEANHVLEWIATRTHAFRFAFSEPSP